MESRACGNCGGKEAEPFHNEGRMNPVKSRLSCEYLSSICAYLDYEASDPEAAMGVKG